MNSHTPGPWTQYAGCGPQVCTVKGKQWIADCKGTLNAEYNARLIAAAPDLLTALQSILREANRDCQVYLLDEFNAARAAITKALGYTP